MTPSVRQLILSAVCLGAAACSDTQRLTGPGATATGTFTGTWQGVRRVVSCSPAGEACASYGVGQESFFATTLTQQGEDVDGSVMLSEPGPLALPYGFPVRGRVATSGQLSFDRLLVDEREPRFSGAVTVRTSAPPELIGRMTQMASSGLPQPITVVWDIVAVQRNSP